MNSFDEDVEQYLKENPGKPLGDAIDEVHALRSVGVLPSTGSRPAHTSASTVDDAALLVGTFDDHVTHYLRANPGADAGEAVDAVFALRRARG